MELYEEETSSPLSPNGQYLTTSALCLTVLVVFEFQAPIHDLQINSMLRTLFVPTNRRFSSVVVSSSSFFIFCLLMFLKISTYLSEIMK